MEKLSNDLFKKLTKDEIKKIRGGAHYGEDTTQTWTTAFGERAGLTDILADPAFAPTAGY